MQVRSSKIRDAIIGILQESPSPISVETIIKNLTHQNLWPNKTTVYRSLETLIKLKKINEVDFLDGRKRYEIADSHGHHHHLICQNCGRSECVEVEKSILKIQSDLEKTTGFIIKTHNLEFFGICDKCR